MVPMKPYFTTLAMCAILLAQPGRSSLTELGEMTNTVSGAQKGKWATACTYLKYIGHTVDYNKADSYIALSSDSPSEAISNGASFKTTASTSNEDVDDTAFSMLGHAYRTTYTNNYLNRGRRPQIRRHGPTLQIDTSQYDYFMVEPLSSSGRMRTTVVYQGPNPYQGRVNFPKHTLESTILTLNKGDPAESKAAEILYACARL
ncbi:hypothetical protein BJ085DRAFT_38229 [Dimargaris cristalligena]|uniref:Uncharacterized protein n=1 Tax=Dimargaris cristalligena TaxID=215637 RepID=A0A4P9ZNR0_9FUNG|nr:hypothetical protein BJ085DRAFT_38229 [Dimargaris cristalligena]|eukprot:RKP34251.1 hypothetical protein BJ085DRAFT_38229 [Dimargaris cristalligena]